MDALHGNGDEVENDLGPFIVPGFVYGHVPLVTFGDFLKTIGQVVKALVHFRIPHVLNQSPHYNEDLEKNHDLAHPCMISCMERKYVIQ